MASAFYSMIFTVTLCKAKNIKIVKFILLLGTSLLITASLFAQDDILYEEEGDTSIVERKSFEGFSLRIPEFENPPKIYKERSVLIFPIVFDDNFSVVLSVSIEDKSENQILLDLFKSDLNKNGKNTIWDERTLYQFSDDEKRLGNFSNGYMKSGHSTENLPMKMFNSMCYLENENRNKVLKFVSGISIMPSHEFYDKYEEIKRFMYDIKIYMLSAKFE